MSKFIIKTVGNVLNATSLVSSKYASEKALQLFASPRQGSYTETQLNLIKDAKQKVFEHESIKITTYHWKGKGKTILLAHGWESNSSRWNYILNDFKAEDYNIIALDAPAHGQSTGRFFTAILYSDCIAKVANHFKPNVIIGHSVGGMASIFSLYDNDLPFVDKIISMGAPAHFKGVFTRYKSMMGYNRRISKGLDKIVLERYGQPIEYFSAAEFTRKINAEGLIVHDKKDRIIPYEDAQLFDNRYKNSKLITTEGFGHSLIDKSLTPQIIEFINN